MRAVYTLSYDFDSYFLLFLYYQLQYKFIYADIIFLSLFSNETLHWKISSKTARSTCSIKLKAVFS